MLSSKSTSNKHHQANGLQLAWTRRRLPRLKTVYCSPEAACCGALCKRGAPLLPQVNLRTHRPAAFDSSSSILSAKGRCWWGGGGQRGPIKGRSGRSRYALLAKMWVSVSVFSRSFLFPCSLFSPLPYLPVCAAEHAAAACRLKTGVAVQRRGGEEAAAVAKERERKREEKQRCNTGALGALRVCVHSPQMCRRRAQK